jgi:hypothetical protein
MGIKWALGSDAGKRSGVNWIDLGDLAVNDWSHIFDDSPAAQMMFERPQVGAVIRFFDSAGVEHETVEEYKDKMYCQRCRLRNPKMGFWHKEL